MSSAIINELKPLFEPSSLAVIGASNTVGKWGYMMVSRPIQSGYRGRIYPVNPKEKEILGLKAYPSLRDIPDPVDLAIITIPAQKVPDAIRDCAEKGIRAAIVITAGFAETGPRGKALQDEMVEIARAGGVRVMGPNGMGIWSSAVRMNTAFWFTPRTGGISFVSQSGTMGGYLLETATNKGYGFNAFLSVGNQADLTMSDYVEYLGHDEATNVIVLYIEGLREGTRFLRTARQVIRKKPIIVYKAGRTEQGSRATLSHTASISGADEIFEALCRQSGIIRFSARRQPRRHSIGGRRTLRGHHGRLLGIRPGSPRTGSQNSGTDPETPASPRPTAPQSDRPCRGSQAHDHRQHHTDTRRQARHRRHHHHGPRGHAFHGAQFRP
ncbi:MAG: CoA-binding protein [Deltaproteobacteria bacterium]|nr:CoA-binding protein [Deltaproteobacteria bacterium]